MIDKQILEKVMEFTKASDNELVILGEEIFISMNPSSEDIDNLNNLRGFVPIMHTFNEIQFSEEFDRVMRSNDIII